MAIEQNNKIIPILILDYNRPNESKNLLLSLKKHLKLEKYVPKIVYLSNGGEQNYVMDYYKEGLIDDLIIRKENLGTGFSSMDLFFFVARYDWAIYCQNDQLLARDITDHDIDQFIQVLGDNREVSHVDISGNQGNGQYSERAHFINIKFYNGIQKEGGGPGPFNHLMWTEESCQRYIKENNMKFVVAQPLFFADVGKWSIRQWKCGTETRHRTDTKEMEFTKLPKKALSDDLIEFYRLTEDEVKVILEGNWRFKIPENMKKDSFTVQGWENI